METGRDSPKGTSGQAPRCRRVLLLVAVLVISALMLGTWLTAVAAPGDKAPIQQGEVIFDLQISKSSNPLAFTIGSGNRYRIDISGYITTTGVSPSIVDILPEGVTQTNISGIDWDCSNSIPTEVRCDYGAALPPGPGLITLNPIFVDVTLATSVGDSIVNTVSLITADANLGNNSFTLVTTVDSVDLELEKTVNPAYADVGETTTYKIVVTNNGPAVARYVVITDTLTADLSYGTPIVTGGNPPTIVGTTLEWTIDSLGADISETLEMTAIPLSSASGDQIINTTRVIDYDNASDWEPGNNEDSASLFVSGLNIAKSVSAVEANVGDNYIYTIDVSNNGTQPATNVYVRDTFDAALDVVTATYRINSGAWTPFSTGNSMNRYIGTLNTGQSATVAVTVRGDSSIVISDTITNTARVTAAPSVIRDSEVVTTTIFAAADLVANKSDGPDEVTPGQTYSYTLEIENIGSITATEIIVTDTLSNHLVFTSVDRGNLVLTPTYTSTTVRVWEIGGYLLPNQSAEFEIGVRVGNNAPVGTNLRNTILASTTATETWTANNTHISDPSLVVEPPGKEDISINLSRTPSQAGVGGTFLFRVVVKNKSDETATDIRIFDKFPAVLDITGVSTNRGTATTNASAREVTVNVPTLSADQVITVTISTRVNSTATGSQIYQHQSELRWDPSNSKFSNSVNYRIVTSTLPGTGGAGAASGAPFSGLALGAGLLLAGLGAAALLYSIWTRTHRPLLTAQFGRAGVILLAVGLVLCLAGLAMGSEPQRQPQLAILGGTKPPPATLQPTPPSPVNKEKAIKEVEHWAPTPTLDSLPDYPIPTPSVIPDEASDTSAVQRIIIPRLQVDTVVKYVPYDGQTWLIGGLKQEVAWMGDSSWPGLGGNTALAGHVDLFDGSDGPFRYLSDLQPGDEVILYTEQNMYFYRVREQVVVGDDEMSVINDNGKPELTLITCTGWDDDLRVYLQRLVVFSDLVEIRPIKEPQATIPLEELGGAASLPKVSKAAVLQTDAESTANPNVAYEPLARQLAEADINPYLPGRKAILVDQATQLMHLFKDGLHVRTMPVSTGLPEFYTPAYSGHVRYNYGTIHTDEGLLADDAWYLFDSTSRIYIHGAPYEMAADGSKTYLELEVIGQRPASHGCIRLLPEDAAWLTAWNPEGAAIVISAPPEKLVLQ
jgi:LPXTG-site transpeptidase (sortase) family protein